jgi:hypothetical protein
VGGLGFSKCTGGSVDFFCRPLEWCMHGHMGMTYDLYRHHVGGCRGRAAERLLTLVHYRSKNAAAAAAARRVLAARARGTRAPRAIPVPPPSPHPPPAPPPPGLYACVPIPTDPRLLAPPYPRHLVPRARTTFARRSSPLGGPAPYHLSRHDRSFRR